MGRGGPSSPDPTRASQLFITHGTAPQRLVLCTRKESFLFVVVVLGFFSFSLFISKRCLIPHIVIEKSFNKTARQKRSQQGNLSVRNPTIPFWQLQG